jgi:hypothetical protein
VAPTEGIRQRTWRWTLGAIAVGFLVAIVQPPLVLVLLVVSGILAFRDRRSSNKTALAVFVGLSVTTCVYLGLVLAHR